MTPTKVRAPAKVNLTLHVTGQRADGYHLLDSLVVFADVADEISVRPADDLTLTVSGPFAEGVPIDDSNLILRAAKALRSARGVTAGAALHLAKTLPHAAGIGSGSSDAAATLRLLADFWDVPELGVDDPAVLALGADVPVCLAGPAPYRMAGIGEELSPWPALPTAALVLVRPDVAVPTGPVFAGLATKNGAPMDVAPDLDFASFAHWLSTQRNDLQPPAIDLVPEIGAVIAALESQDGVAFAGMSGSGATCFGLVSDIADATAVADALRKSYPNYWIAAGALL